MCTPIPNETLHGVNTVIPLIIGTVVILSVVMSILALTNNTSVTEDLGKILIITGTVVIALPGLTGLAIYHTLFK